MADERRKHLHALWDLVSRAVAADVFVQRAAGSLPNMQRPGHAYGARSAAAGAERRADAARWRGALLGRTAQEKGLVGLSLPGLDRQSVRVQYGYALGADVRARPQCDHFR